MSVIGSNVLAGASGGAGGAGFAIERSLRFNSGDSSFLSRTPSSAGNRKTWTWSNWVKRSASGAYVLFRGGTSSNDSQYFAIQFNANDKLTVGAETLDYLATTQVFRDFSAWYHIVVALDVNQGANANKLKLYINGAEVTAFDTDNRSSLSTSDKGVNQTQAHVIGAEPITSNRYLNGYLAEINFIDGSQLDPTSFGQADANGVWQPKEFAGTYGTNGFHLDFKDNSSSSALGNDAAGSNNWTVNNLTANVPQPSSSFTWSGSLLSGTGGSGTAGDSYTGSYFQIPAGTSSWDLHNETDGNTGFWFSDSSSQVAGHPPDQNGNFVALRNNGSGTASTDGSGFSSTGFPTDSMDGDPRWYFTVNRTTGAGTVKVGPSGTVYNFTVPTTGNVYFHVNAYGAYNYNLGYGDPSNQDSLVDTPTNGDTASDTGAGGEVVGNYATLNPLNAHTSSDTFSNGNLDFTTSSGGGLSESTIAMSSGKYYFEVVYSGGQGTGQLAGIRKPGKRNYNDSYIYVGTGNKYTDGGSSASYGASLTNGDVIGTAFDADNGTLTFYKNGVSQGTAFTGITGTYAFFTGSFGSSPTFVVNFGQRAFAYTAPSGYKALCTSSLPTPTIADGSKYFDTKLYTGNSGTQSITGYNFSPDFLWIKSRTNPATGYFHHLHDSVRGLSSGFYKSLYSNGVEADNAYAGSTYGGVNSLNSDGFGLANVGSNYHLNNNTTPYVAWAWDAGANSDRTYTVTVSGGNFYIDGAQQPTLTLAEGSTYKFDQSASTNATHPLRFSTTSDGTHGGGSEYTTGVTTAGTPGSAGAYTQIVIAASAPTLYAYCTNHSGMGFQVNTSDKGGATNLDGTITSQVMANPSAGFSIVSYAGNSSNNATIGHGLNAAPELIITKNRDGAYNWITYSAELAATKVLALDGNYAAFTPSGGYYSNVGNSTYQLVQGSANLTNVNNSGNDYIAYCFAPVAGYSAMGSYTGNGSSDGVFVHTGFKIAYLVIKCTSHTSMWSCWDTARDVDNFSEHRLRLDQSNAEESGDSNIYIDLLSNGFKTRAADTDTNGSGRTYVYIAFASHPFASNGGLAR